MNELIIFQDNKPIISSEFKENYKKFVNLKSQIEEAQAVIKKELINYYESLPEEERKTIDFDTFKVSYVKSSTRKTFDSKRLQDEDIDTYNKYLKTTEVSSTIKYM
jgi:uncharacterized protein YfbU (UPF0304 family)